MCEDLENMDGLHHLYSIFRTLFLFNKSSLLSIMFQPDLIMDVIGCLEYNPSKPHPIKHRLYLQNTSRHRNVIALDNPELLNKIHLTYKIIYIQEVILPTPSLFEENMMSALNSIILFSKTEIVNTILVGLHVNTCTVESGITLLHNKPLNDYTYTCLIHFKIL